MLRQFSARTGAKPYVLLATAGLVWGITFSLAKIAAQAGAHPIGLTLWQAVIGLVILGSYCLIRRIPLDWSRAGLMRALFIALAGTILPSTMYFYAAARLPVAILSITIAMVPIVTYGASLMVRSDQYHPKRMLGLGLGLAGMVLLSQPEALPDRSMLPWLVLAILCAVSYAVENLFVDNRVPPGTDMGALLTASMLISTVVLLPLVFLTGVFVPFQFPFGSLELAVTGMGVVTCFAYLIFLQLIRISGAVFASMMAYVVTLSGVAWGMIIFDERPPGIVWLVLVLMIAGMALVKPLEKHVEKHVEKQAKATVS
jgi:drug/metabolite transporter (DMT)-like permease